MSDISEAKFCFQQAHKAAIKLKEVSAMMYLTEGLILLAKHLERQPDVHRSLAASHEHPEPDGDTENG